jgi:hypothetical protein
MMLESIPTPLKPRTCGRTVVLQSPPIPENKWQCVMLSCFSVESPHASSNQTMSMGPRGEKHKPPLKFIGGTLPWT